MVGLKTVWSTLVMLLFVASCVPQTKQTQCASNEAFNSSLRTCVPVVNSASSFISITSTIPTTSYSRYKNDSTSSMQFKIYISNPYNQSYTTSWKRIYNGVSTAVTGLADPTEWNIYPSFFVNEVGFHLLTVDILDSTNTIVTSHTFQFIINDSPRPYIYSKTPNAYDVTGLTPASSSQAFSVTVKNNGASIATTSTYQVQWTLLKNGASTSVTAVPGNTANQNFSTITTTGTNTGTLTFDPAIFGLGSYLLSARVVYTSTNEVVDEKVWSINVLNPALSQITARALIKNSSLNVLTPVIAYNGIDYNSYTSYSFRPAGQAQANFCVKVASGEGTYTGDGLFVKVSFYLDGVGTAIYEALTSAVTNEICLSDAAAGTLSSVLFTNSSPTTTQAHKIFATVYDEATAQSYTLNDMATGLGDYPIYWNVTVKPLNTSPTVAFGTDTVLTSCSTAGYTKSGCAVQSDTSFTVGMNLTNDDFYYSAYDLTKFVYTATLYKDSVAITSCSSSANATTSFSCSLSIPSYDAAGPLNPQTPVYQIKSSVTDVGSPFTTTPATSNELTWNLVVTEKNSAPSIAAFSSSATADEGTSLPFTITVNDSERDNYTYQIKYCTDVACTPALAQNFTSLTTVTRTTNALASTVTPSQTLAEDFLLNIPTCATTARNASCNVKFYVVVTDIPSNGTVTPLSVTSSTVTVSVKNINATPVINLALATPTTAFSGNVMVGMPLTISASAAGVITDPSTVSLEQVTRYQWYSKQSAQATWTAINGADSANLTWTPSLMTTPGVINLALCLQDQSTSISASVPDPATAGSICSSSYSVNVKNNIVQTQATDIAKTGSETGIETAVWVDTPAAMISGTGSVAYQAYIGNDGNIHVKKVRVLNDGQMLPYGSTYEISFTPLPANSQNAKDLTITGNGNSLYVSYLANTVASPLVYNLQVRRIDISSGKLSSNVHAGKFGFDYDGIDIDISNCSSAAYCVVTNPKDGTAPTIQFSGSATTGSLTLTTAAGSKLIPFSLSNPAPLGSICSACSANQKATDFAAAINQDTGIELMGISASVAGSTATINGSLALDYLNSASSATVNPVYQQAGQIFIQGSYWYVPVISGSSLVSIVKAQVDLNLNQGAGKPSVLDASNDATINGLPLVSKLSAYSDGTNLHLALITQTGGSAKLYKFTNMTSTPITLGSSNTTLMNGLTVNEIQTVASASNVFVLTKINSPSNYRLGVYNSALVTQNEFYIDDTSYVDAATAAHFNVTNIAYSRLVATSGTEARLVSSLTTNASDYYLYMARIYQNAAPNWGMSCLDCNQISQTELKVSPYVKFKTAQLRAKVAANTNYALGSDGAITNESIKDVAFIGFGQMDTGATNAYPYLGVFNIETEGIDSATIPATDAGYFRSPFVR